MSPISEFSFSQFEDTERFLDRDRVAMHTGRIMQSCAVVENSLFKMIAARNDIAKFAEIKRTTRPALRNIINEVKLALQADNNKEKPAFKNPKRLNIVLEEFDKVAAARSDLAHAEFLTVGEIDQEKVAVLSNEGTGGSAYKGRKVQIVSFSDLKSLDQLAHRTAHTLQQLLTNQLVPPVCLKLKNNQPSKQKAPSP
jgi:hypothetical protein